MGGYCALGIALAAGIVGLAPLATAQVLKEDDLHSSYGVAELISLTRGYRQPISRAPVVVSVITRDDIGATGATTLGEILELVPGFHSVFRFVTPQLVFRGIRTAGNTPPDVVIRVDGVPQNDVVLGSQRQLIAEVPLQMIERVDVIRGPYSVLYGTDAFSGSINIITRDYKSLDGSEVSVRGGSFDTAELRATFTRPLPDGMVLSAQLRTTDGHEPFFTEDAQTRLDEMFGTNASLAPSHANTLRRDYNLMLDYNLEKWRVRLRTRGKEAGNGIGIVGAFDPSGETVDTQYTAELRFRDPDINQWAVTADSSFWWFRWGGKDWTAFPPGAFSGAFPDGVIDIPEFTEVHYRFETSGTYTGFGKFRPLIGAGVEHADVTDVNERRNFVPDPVSGLPTTPLAGTEEVPHDLLFLTPRSRTVAFAYLDNEIHLSRNWTLYAGARYDHYSDVRDSFTPRAALVWTPTLKLSTKLLAGRGFRSPTMIELYSDNQPAAKGNPNLDPVTVTSVAFSTNYRVSAQTSVDLSLFYYEIDDLIDSTPFPVGQRFTNVGGQKGHGLELHGQMKLTRTLSLSGHYAYQTNKRDDTNDDISMAPRHKVVLRADWRPVSEWRLNGLWTWVGQRQREQGDTRPKADAYNQFDINVLFEPTAQWTVGLAVNNIFNQAGVAAEERNDSDIELPERNAFLTVKYQF